MALITPDWTGTLPQGMQTTQPMILKRFLEDTGLGQTGTASGGSTTTITDATMLDNDNASDQQYRGGWIRMTGGTANNLGLIRALTDESPTAGTLTFAPALPSTVAASDTYEIWMTPDHPNVILSIFDRFLTQSGIHMPCYTFLSEVPDYDMEATGTSAWTSSNATLAKVAWSAGQEGVMGKQAMTVATTSANGYATSQRGYGVKQGAALWVSIQFTPSNPAVTNTGFLQLVDVATGAVIDSITTVSKSSVRLRKYMNAGTSTFVNVRFGSQESGVTGVWDELVVLDAQAKDAPLPSWVSNHSDIKEIYTWNPAQAGALSGEYDPALIGDRTVYWTPMSDAFGSGQMRIQSPFRAPEMLFILGVRNETSWASLTEVKFVDPAWAAAGLAVKVYTRILGRYQAQAAERKPILERLGYWADQWDQENRRVMSRRRANDSAPTQWAYSA